MERSCVRLISTMGFPILVERHLCIESGPRVLALSVHQKPWYWPSNVNEPLYSIRKDFSNLTISVLTHLPLKKMAAILGNGILKCIFLNENVRILIVISLKCVPKGPIDNNSALVQVMAWLRTGDKPLPEPMVTQFTDAYMRHLGKMS